MFGSGGRGGDKGMNDWLSGWLVGLQDKCPSILFRLFVCHQGRENWMLVESFGLLFIVQNKIFAFLRCSSS